MFRGALILAIGYIAGYAHSSSQNDEVSKAVHDLRQAWAEAKTAPTEPETGETSTEGETTP